MHFLKKFRLLPVSDVLPGPWPLPACRFLIRGGSELSPSSKVRDFVPDFLSSKKFEVRELVHEPENFSFMKLFF